MWDQIVSVPDHCLSLYSVEFPETRHFFCVWPYSLLLFSQITCLIESY